MAVTATQLGLLNLFDEVSQGVTYKLEESNRATIWMKYILPNASMPNSIGFNKLRGVAEETPSTFIPVAHHFATLIGFQALVDCHYAYKCYKMNTTLKNVLSRTAQPPKVPAQNDEKNKSKDEDTQVVAQSRKLQITTYSLIISSLMRVFLLPLTWLPNVAKNIALYATFAIACLAEGCHKLANTLYQCGGVGVPVAAICLALSTVFHLIRAIAQQILQPIERAASAKEWIKNKFQDQPVPFHLEKIAAAISFVISMCLIGALIAFTPVGWMHAAHTLAMSIPLAHTYITAITGTFFHAIGSFLSTVTHGFGFFARCCGSSFVATSANATTELGSMTGSAITTALVASAIPAMGISAALKGS